MSTPFLKKILRFAIENNASDVHFSSGMPPVLRILGEIKKVDMEPIEEEALSGELLQLMNDGQKEAFHRRQEIDMAVSIDEESRFRVNVYRQFKGVSAAFRIIKPRVNTLDELNMPSILKKLVDHRKGLILVTGPTGSGKSTTLAAMLHEINLNRREHIITIEDPIEYLHSPVQSIIHQREVGVHTENFAQALRNALREDPDVILVGEMRDLETVTYALRAAETGHLVLSTLHTNSAGETIDRIVNVFPPEQQESVKMMLASTTLAVISQRLVPMAMKQDRVAVMEILIVTSAVRNLIREGKTFQLDSAIQTGAEYGMQTFERSLTYLKQNNFVSPQIRLNEII